MLAECSMQPYGTPLAGAFLFLSVEFASLAEVLAYIELNPVRAGLVKRPEDWKWASARAHLMAIDKTWLLDMT
jgi:hypothetical protein